MNKVLLFSFIFFIPITSAIGLTINQQPTNLPNLIPTNNIIAFNNNTAFVNNSVYWQGYIPSTFIPAFVAPSFTTFAYVNNNINNNISSLSNTYVQIGNLTPTYVPYNGANKNVNLGNYNLSGGALSAGSSSFYSDGSHTPNLESYSSNGSGNYVGIGYDSTNDYGYIYSVNHNVAWKTLILNPFNDGVVSIGQTSGGALGIGTTSPIGQVNVARPNGNPAWFRVDSGGYHNEFGVAGLPGDFISGYTQTGDGVFKFTGQNFFLAQGSVGQNMFLIANTTGATNILSFVPVAGNVGIGTPYPNTKLEVDGDVFLNSSLNPCLYFGATKYSCIQADGANLVLNPAVVGNGGVNILNKLNVSNLLFVNSTKVGIGTATPSQALDVIGNTNITGNLSSGGFFGGIDTISTSGVTEIPLNQTLQIVNFSEITLNNGFSLVNNTNLVLNDNLGSGAYDISWSYRAIGSNNHNYLGYIFINGNQINNTFDFEIGQSNNFIRMTGEGQARINAGDNITLRIADTNGTSTIQVYKKQIDIKRIGN